MCYINNYNLKLTCHVASSVPYDMVIDICCNIYSITTQHYYEVTTCHTMVDWNTWESWCGMKRKQSAFNYWGEYINRVMLCSEVEMGICIQECPIQLLLCSHVIWILCMSHVITKFGIITSSICINYLNDNPLSNIFALHGHRAIYISFSLSKLHIFKI